jgi:hypothetical protein
VAILLNITFLRMFCNHHSVCFQGRCIFACGSHSDPVTVNGKLLHAGQVCIPESLLLVSSCILYVFYTVKIAKRKLWEPVPYSDDLLQFPIALSKKGAEWIVKLSK